MAIGDTTTVTTYSAVATRIGLTGTTNQTMVNQIIDEVTDQFAVVLKRPIWRDASRTDYLTGDNSNVIQLPLYPIESITSVTIASDVDFDAATALTANDDYRFDPANGLLYREADIWPRYVRGIKVVYVAGYVHPDDSPGATNFALPYDIIGAGIQQVCYVYERRMGYSQKGEKTGDGSVALIENEELLPGVIGVLRRYMTQVV